ncbi:hypothetical protein CVT25_001794 [Psilocybe cyanescens]|uniref:Uncharacterized protein n=1 Tax=Psilocybe cyanescens TaxID=93625 RepID=A0A409X5G3_PSICY|nr:hypothetical protein CVT25_001794 [Psilocybe cyanescens]
MSGMVLDTIGVLVVGIDKSERALLTTLRRLGFLWSDARNECLRDDNASEACRFIIQLREHAIPTNSHQLRVLSRQIRAILPPDIFVTPQNSPSS